MASLLAQNISKTYVRVPVLQDVTLSVGAASVHCLAGENGSGKSTLIKIISGTLSTDAGKVIIDGHDATADASEAQDARIARFSEIDSEG